MRRVPRNVVLNKQLYIYIYIGNSEKYKFAPIPATNTFRG